MRVGEGRGIARGAGVCRRGLDECEGWRCGKGGFWAGGVRIGGVAKLVV